MPFVTSSNMNLPVPVVGSEPGPDYANDINNCLAIIDQHNHSSGSGVQITPAGLNINSDLAFNSNNLTLIRTARFNPQSAVLSLGTDLDCLYVVGVDLYYNDGNGNNVRITQSGGVAGSPGSIANLSSPASASYVAGSSTFVWQSAANTPANMDAASYILRNLTVSSKGLTLAPPNAMGADYTITLPALPLATNILMMDTSGNVTANLNVDNSTLQISGNTLSVKASGITSTQIAASAVGTTQIAAGAVTQVKRAAATINVTGQINFSGTSTVFDLVTGGSLSITTNGRPLLITIQPFTGTNGGFFAQPSGTPSPGVTGGLFRIMVDTTDIGEGNLADTTVKNSHAIVTNSFAAGTHTIALQYKVNAGYTGIFSNVQVTCTEL